MPRLYLPDTNKTLGEITDEQLRFLIDHLEEEHAQDRDYYINQDTLDMLRDRGGDEDLMSLLVQALGDQEDVDIAWE